MATYTSLINSVLRRMREAEVAGPDSSAYATLIGDFVNQTKREVEDAWKWSALHQTIPVTTTNGVSQYAVTGATKRFHLQSTRFNVFNTTTKANLTGKNASFLKKKLLVTPDPSQPSNYYFEGFDTAGDPYINFYPAADDAYVINLELIVPQEDFTLGTEVLAVPDWPVILGAYAKALAERGEDNGKTHGEALNQFAFALSDAIALDISLLDQSELTWYA